MKFLEAKGFREGQVEDWIKYSLVPFLRDLIVGLRRLSFSDNFESFTWSGTVTAGAEERIINKLRAIPSQMLVTMATGGNSIVAASTAWTNDFIYLENVGATDATVTILFMK